MGVTSLLIFACLTSVQALKMAINSVHLKNDEEWTPKKYENKICDGNLCYDTDGEQADDGEHIIEDFQKEMGLQWDEIINHRSEPLDMDMNKILQSTVLTYTGADCPKVFMYDLPKPFQDQPDLMNISFEAAFGPRVDENVTQTKQWSLATVIAYKVLHSSCGTTDPLEADLFFVPLLAAPKSASKWHRACSSVKGKANELEQLLPHLNNETAKKHFMLMGKGFYHGWCDGTWRKPEGLFAKMARVSVQMLITPSIAEKLTDQHGDDMKRMRQQMVKSEAFPRHFTVPYPSFYHGEAFNWDATEERKFLATFVGKTDHGDEKARSTVGRYCNKNGLSCFPYTGAKANNNIKRNSVFCLEPVGDALARKSLVDAYAAGCIPVFFGNGSPMQYFLQYNGWEKDAYILIDRPKFIKGQVDLIQQLSSISQERIVEMRKAIRENAHSFLYVESYNHRQYDAMTVLLKKLKYDADHDL